MTMRLLSCCAVLALCAACSRPPPPDKEHPPEPQATALAQAIQAPIDQARDVQQVVDEATAERDAEIERQEQ